MTLSITNIKAQSGGWDSFGTNGTSGYIDHGNGVIQLLNTTAGCAAGAIHETTDTYDPTSNTSFNKCYQVFFGCPDNDEIGLDQKGDGIAFSFSKCVYNINNGNACGGGLGYMGSCGQMLTLEFDTWSSQGNAGFDANYGGGTSGNNDEIALHRDGNASDAGRITSTNAGNLEDGLEHVVCINYNHITHILSATIDGNTLFSYNLTGSPYDLPTYFGAGGLNQTWSSGKNGATNPSTVSNGSDITDEIGGPLCPANVVITSPSNGTTVGSCNGPISITAASTAPASNTVSQIEFFVDGVSIGIDNSFPYQMIWGSPGIGSHLITAVSTFVPSNSTSTSSPVSVSVGGGIELTSSAPIMDGVVDAIWGNYVSTTMNQVPWGTIAGSTDLTGNFKTMRDATNLYILVMVTDDDIVNDGGPDKWENDGIEIFIDKGNDKNTIYGANDFQYAFAYNDASVTEYKHAPTSLAGVTFAQGLIVGGYYIEMSIPWATIGGAPIDGELIGFDVHINDDDGGGTRNGKLAWNDAIDIAFNNPSGFGTTQASACNPCPTGILSGNSIICETSATSMLSVDFTGNVPWSFIFAIDGINQPLVSNITANPYAFESITGVHNYSLVSVSNTQTSGCINNTSGTVTISLNTIIPAANDVTFSSPSSATLSVIDEGGIYEWYDAINGGNLLFTGAMYTTPVLTDTTTYYVQELAGAPCRTEVRAIPLVDLGEFFIPNLITPNGDGDNEAFEILALPSGSVLSIFNRWGDRIYQTTDYDNFWAGKNTSDGVYYYDLLLPDGKQYKGWVSIVR